MNYYSEIKARIDENKSFLKMAELHMDERATVVINQRIFELEKELESLPAPAMVVEDGWIDVKDEFKADCLVICGTKIRDEWDYTLFQVKETEFNGGTYMGWFTADGEEYGDLEDMKADKYLIINPNQPSYRMV